MATGLDLKPKTSQSKIDPFGRMLLRVSKHLTETHRKDICMLYGFTPFETENVNTGTDLLSLMREKGIFDPQNVTELIDTFTELGLKAAVSDIEEYLRDTGERQDEMPGIKGQMKTDTDHEATQRWLSYEKNISYLHYSEDSVRSCKTLTKSLHFLVLGKTGSGKSATGNTILKDRVFEEGHGIQSKTRTISFKNVVEDGMHITVIDTPGLFDTVSSNADKNRQNQQLCLEIARTAINFKEGIHLFLLVYNPYWKFTKEEEDTIQHIEDVLKKEMYDYCVLILTHSGQRFRQISLQQFLEEEKENGGRFAKLLDDVDNRVVGVENSFEEALFQGKQRQILLNSLAEIVSRNEGGAYHNEVFDVANEAVKKETKEREGRFDKTESLLKMQQILDDYAYNLLFSYTFQYTQLRDLKVYFQKSIATICMTTGVTKLPFIEEGDVKAHLNNFLSKNETLIQECIKLTTSRDCKDKISTLAPQQGITRAGEETLKMQKFVFLFIDNLITKSSKEYRTELVRGSKLPDDQWKSLLNYLTEKGVVAREEDVQTFVTSTFFESSDTLNRYIVSSNACAQNVNEIEHELKMIETKRKKEVHDIVQQKIPSFTRHLDLDKRKKFKDALLDRNDELSTFVQEFIKVCVVTKDPTKTQEMYETCFKEKKDFIEGIMVMLEDERRRSEENENERMIEKKKNERLRHISDVIDKRLKNYVTKNSLDELKGIDNTLFVDNKVPDDILKEILRHVHEEIKLEVEASTIEHEILTQLRSKRKTIEDVKKKASKCFPETCTAITRCNIKKPVSMLKIGDEVLVYDSNGKLKYDRVYLLSHANGDVTATYKQIVTEKGNVLLISPNHYLPVDDLRNIVPAEKAMVGRAVFTVRDGVLTREKITSVAIKTCKGAFCPMTMNGTIVVNNVAATCFTTFFNPTWGQMFLCPVRIMFNYFPTWLYNNVLPYDPVEGMPVILAKFRSAIIFFRTLFET